MAKKWLLEMLARPGKQEEGGKSAAAAAVAATAEGKRL